MVNVFSKRTAGFLYNMFVFKSCRLLQLYFEQFFAKAVEFSQNTIASVNSYFVTIKMYCFTNLTVGTQVIWVLVNARDVKY